MTAAKRLTDATIRSVLTSVRTEDICLPDASVPGLSLRIYPSGTATWNLFIRVVGEGGVNSYGRALLGRKHRLNLGSYPEITLEEVRAKANECIDQANRGSNPKKLLAASATAGTATVQELSETYMREYVHSKGLDSAPLCAMAFKVHINPVVGHEIAELLTREQVRRVMNGAREKRDHPDGKPGMQIGGIEAARTAMRVLRQMYSWAIDEEKLKRQDNPCRNIVKNLPKANKGEVVLSLREARIVWQAATECGYPFGTHAQLMLLTGCRMDEWASAQSSWIDLDAALMIVPSSDYKSDHVHVVPLVPQAVQILRWIPRPSEGRYLLSSRGGRVPIRGVPKFFKTTLATQIIALTGSRLPKRLTSHVLRRTVATRLAELLGDEGDKLVKRVLGHADGSVTAIYNRYGYIREIRRALEMWANELTSDVESDLRQARDASTAGAAVGPSYHDTNRAGNVRWLRFPQSVESQGELQSSADVRLAMQSGQKSEAMPVASHASDVIDIDSRVKRTR